ncbi:MAG: hypothetical protein ABIR94_07340 [Rubrivivax sp.]
MRRSALLLLTLFALLWQSVTLARAGSAGNALANLEHAALHWQESGHHHHEDGSFHLDDSTESAQHVIADHLSANAVLMTSDAFGLPSPASNPPGGWQDRAAPHPYLDGLLRPPRLHS